MVEDKQTDRFRLRNKKIVTVLNNYQRSKKEQEDLLKDRWNSELIQLTGLQFPDIKLLDYVIKKFSSRRQADRFRLRNKKKLNEQNNYQR